MGETKIIFNDKTLEYNRVENYITKKNNLFLIWLIIFVVFFLSVSYSLLINFEWEPLKTLELFKRIKKNMNSWATISNEKTAIEVNKGKLLYLTNTSVADFQCIDYGSYIVPGRISSTTYLPEFVRRGNSGPWIINKADTNDLSSLQFCKFLLNKYVTKSTSLDGLISCGGDMLEKLGYTGYFIPNGPCEKTLSLLI